MLMQRGTRNNSHVINFKFIGEIGKVLRQLADLQNIKLENDTKQKM